MSLIKVNTRGGGSKAPTQQIFDTAGTHTYTKPSGCSKVKVTVVGGGGGGGGCRRASNTPSVIITSGAGGAGGTAIKLIDGASVGATETITVGAGGAGGVGYHAIAGGSVAENGGQSSFGSHCTASGGGHGWHTGHTNTSSASVRSMNGAGGAGGKGYGGDINLTGGSPTRHSVPFHLFYDNNATDMATIEHGHVGTTRYIFTHEGGVSSIMGGQATQAGTSYGGTAFSAGIGLSGSSVGTGIAYGNGGNGAYSSSNSNSYQQVNSTGGAGAPGVVIVEEFY